MNLKKDLLTLLHRRSDKTGGSKLASENIGNISMKDGEHGKIFGINRKIVTTVIIIGFTVFAIALIFALSDDTSKSKTQTPQIKQEVADTKNSPMTSGTDDYANNYAKLGQANNRAATGGTMSKNTTRQVNPATTATPLGSSEASTLAAIPAARGSYADTGSYSSPYTLPYLNATNMSQGAASGTGNSAAEQPKTESVQDRLKAAISFALGQGGSTNNAVGGSTAPTSATASGGSDTTDGAVTYMAPSDTFLQVGTVIPAMLCSGINTDVGGQVSAQVQADVYDSATGSTLLIPAGSRLMGSYEAGKASTSGRLSITFTTLILPNGGSYNIGQSMIATDADGYMGIAGNVNSHTGKAISGGMLSTAIAALGSLATGGTSSSSNTYSAGQLAEQGAMSSLITSASSLFNKGASIQATITVDPGYQFNVYIKQGISLSAY